MNKIFTVFYIAILVCYAQPQQDKVKDPPGMPDAPNIYSGYLETKSVNRSLHYILVQSENDPVNDPLLLWLNGGPGCSSLLGMLHLIGPYYVGNNYTKGDNLTKNLYGWTKIANILFIEYPAGVGFSINTEKDFNYTDYQTAEDGFTALLYLFAKKFPNLKKNEFYIGGQSYAGKYIPDLTVRILDNNVKNPSTAINIKGILVGNGVMYFENYAFYKSTIQFLGEHDFIGPHLYDIYKSSCMQNFNSPRCLFAQNKIFQIRQSVQYNIFDVCTRQSSEAQILKSFLKLKKQQPQSLKQIPPCRSDDGINRYFTAHKDQYNIKSYPDDWTSCANITYIMSQNASLNQYKKIFSLNSIRVLLYHGDWDDVVPYGGTRKYIELIPLRPIGSWTPWFVDGNHAGFYQYYPRNLTMMTVKGASHRAPETKRPETYQMFYNFIKKVPPSDPIPIN